MMIPARIVRCFHAGRTPPREPSRPGTKPNPPKDPTPPAPAAALARARLFLAA
jgi:hypothetical protein